MRFFKFLAIKVIIFSILTIFTGYNLIALYINLPGPLQEEKIILFKRGVSKKAIANILYENSIIKHPKIFLLLIKLYSIKNNIKSGEYYFSSKISIKQVINIFSKGTSVIHKITFPEGLTNFEIINKLNEETLLIGKLDKNVEEGWLMPETYYFSYYDKKQDILLTMKKKLSDFLNESWEDKSANLPIKTKEEAIILASIIEKEASSELEKPIIASIYINRLKMGMRLQADPTIIYTISNKGEKKFSRRVTFKDLKVDSPYNTYLYKGLPPSAICNPSKSSIEAALRPANTKYLYFVVDGKGGHKFAENFIQHQRNIIEYKNYIKQIRDDNDKTKSDPF